MLRSSAWTYKTATLHTKQYSFVPHSYSFLPLLFPTTFRSVIVPLRYTKTSLHFVPHKGPSVFVLVAPLVSFFIFNSALRPPYGRLLSIKKSSLWVAFVLSRYYFACVDVALILRYATHSRQRLAFAVAYCMAHRFGRNALRLCHGFWNSATLQSKNHAKGLPLRGRSPPFSAKASNSPAFLLCSMRSGAHATPVYFFR